MLLQRLAFKATITLTILSCDSGISTPPARFLVPNFSDNSLSRFDLRGSFLEETSYRITTHHQPSSVVERNGLLIVANWGADRLSVYEGEVTNSIPKFTISTTTAGLTKPHHLILHPSLPILYVVHESSPGAVSTWQIEASGNLMLQQKYELLGDKTSTVTASDDFRFIYVSCPGNGSIYVFDVTSSGLLTSKRQFLVGTGEPYLALPLSNASLLAVIFYTGNRLSLFAWDSNTGTIGDLNHNVFLGHGAQPRWLSYLPMNNLLVIASSATGTLRFYDLADKIIVQEYSIHELPNPRATVVAPGSEIILCSVDNGIAVVEWKHGRPHWLRTFPAGKLPLFGSFRVSWK